MNVQVGTLEVTDTFEYNGLVYMVIEKNQKGRVTANRLDGETPFWFEPLTMVKKS